MNPGFKITFFGINISPWVSGPVLFILWLAILYPIKIFLFHKIRNWGAKTRTKLDDILIQSLNLPLNIIILAGGIALFERFLSLPVNIDKAMAILAKVLFILAFFIFFDRFINLLIKRYGKDFTTFDLSRGIVHGIIRFIILGLALLIVIDSFGISITPFVASLGIGTLAVALALQSTLANFFAGIFILADKPIRTGDFIRLDSGEEGYVLDIGWRSTAIRMLPNVVVTIPNDKLVSSTIHNYCLPEREVMVFVGLGVHYDSDLRKVEDLALHVAREMQKTVKGAVPDFEPFLRYNSFGGSKINFNVIMRVYEYVDQYLLKHEFIKALHERFKKEGIVIPYPLTTLDISEKTIKEFRDYMQESDGKEH